MSIEDVRMFALSSGDVDERFPFCGFPGAGDTLVFYKGKKTFLYIDLNDCGHNLTLRCRPECMEDVLERYATARRSRHFAGKWLCISADEPEEDVIKQMIKDSYDMI